MHPKQLEPSDIEFEQEHRIAYLIATFIQDKLSPAEREELDNWVGDSKENLLLFEELTDDKQLSKTLKWFHKLDVEKAKKRVHEKISIKTTQPFWSKFWPYTAAASILIIALIALFLLNQKNTIPVITDNPQTSKPIPGGNKAILTLANGRKILLDSAANGSIATEGSSAVIKTDSILSYKANEKPITSSVSYNSITVPKGGKYQLVLSDGTKVWLNAASSLRFPAAFSGKERKVELTGEGYFEVAKNKEMPFRVDAAKAEITVLGTHFNVRSYEDVADMETTLLEGVVRITIENKEALLKPGEQAKTKMGGSSQNIRILKNVDTEKVSAWKEGLFIFRNDDLKDIMRALGNWYNINVVYSSNISKHFSGTFDRKEPLSKILKYLEGTGEVHFKLKDSILTVFP